MADLSSASYHIPEKEDRVNDPHISALDYVKENLNYVHSQYLETAGNKCIWIEIIMKHKR